MKTHPNIVRPLIMTAVASTVIAALLMAAGPTGRSVKTSGAQASVPLAADRAGGPSPDPAASDPAWLAVRGRDIVDGHGRPRVLRGVSLIDLQAEESVGPGVRWLIDRATDPAEGWHARVIRLPVYPRLGRFGWCADPERYLRECLDPAVRYCTALKVYCIIDWHWIGDYAGAGTDHDTRAFWSTVAARYRNNPYVLYELFNEPVLPDSWLTWQSRAQPWIDLIRSKAPRNLILVGGPNWSRSVGGAIGHPMTGRNIVYVVHIYPRHDSRRWQEWFGRAADRYPIFLTEWGWEERHGSEVKGTRARYGEPLKAFVESKGNISWTAWCFDNAWSPAMFDGRWRLKAGNAYPGEFARNWLFEHRGESEDRNPVRNGGFSTGDAFPWTLTGDCRPISALPNGTRSNSVTQPPQSGLRIDGDHSGAAQIVEGLEPSTTYVLTARAHVQTQGETLQIGVADFRGPGSRAIAPVWNIEDRSISVRFVTGPGCTSARVFCYKPDGANPAYAGDFTLSKQGFDWKGWNTHGHGA